MVRAPERRYFADGATVSAFIDDAIAGKDLRGGRAVLEDSDLGVEAYFRSSVQGLLHQIPSLDSRSATGQWMQLDCMVQDTSYGQEIFPGLVKDTELGVYRFVRYADVTGIALNETDLRDVVLDERASLLVVPIPGMREQQWQEVVVKCYAGMESRIKVCDVIRVYGLFEASGLPVLHAISVEVKSLLTLNSIEGGFPRTARAVLLDKLAGILANDVLAAELILLSVVSGVYKRTDKLPIGALSINLSHCPQDTIDILQNCFREILPAMVYRKLSIPLLNSEQFYPSSDGERMRGGSLQVPCGTTVLIDETLLDQGKLETTGVMNMRYLQNILHTQKMQFYYPFSDFGVDTDLNVLLLGPSKSLLKVCRRFFGKNSDYQTDFVMPLVAGSSMRQPLTVSTLSCRDFRNYILHVRQLAPPEVSDEIAAHMQTAFVHTRKHSAASVPTEWLEKRILLTMLTAKSHGRTRLEIADWDNANTLLEGLNERLAA